MTKNMKNQTNLKQAYFSELITICMSATILLILFIITY